jgi:hypothetical protein
MKLGDIADWGDAAWRRIYRPDCGPRAACALTLALGRRRRLAPRRDAVNGTGGVRLSKLEAQRIRWCRVALSIGRERFGRAFDRPHLPGRQSKGKRGEDHQTIRQGQAVKVVHQR